MREIRPFEKIGQFTCPHCGATMCLTIRNMCNHKCREKDYEELKKQINKLIKKHERKK